MNNKYKEAGVDIDAGNRFVDLIKPAIKKTMRRGVLTDIGGYGGLLALDSAKYKEPVLVSSTDGVGTKLMVAFMTGKHDTVGIDMVAMNVNDGTITSWKCFTPLAISAMCSADVPELQTSAPGTPR